MADPTIQTFCCHHRGRADSAFYLMSAFSEESFLIISIISSTIGILGAVYQIFIRKSPRVEGGTSRSVTGRRIIVYLAWSDLFASIGVLFRSSLWSFMSFDDMPYFNDDKSVIFCSISSAFIQVFYTASWFWTFIYAYNMKKALKNQPVKERNFHFFVWSFAVLLTSIGTTTLYFPNGECHDSDDNFTTVLIHVMPNYFFNYGPILFVMIVNPIIYYKCSKEVNRQLILRSGQYTNNERQTHDLFKIKFSLINVIFYICWMPNVINAILVWSSWSALTRTSTIGTIVVINWYLVAVLNPLQAFFNALVYRSWNESVGCCEVFRKWFTRRNIQYTSQNLSETSPLLLTSSSTRLSRNDDDFHKHSIQCPLV